MDQAILYHDSVEGKYRIKIRGVNIAFSKNKSYLTKLYGEKFLQMKFALRNNYDYIPELIDETGEEPQAVAQAAQQSRFSINERFEFLESLIKMVLNGVTHSMIVTGEGGTGKTHTVRQILVNSKMTEDVDYKMISGFTTPKALFRLMHDYRDKILIFDDCDSVFKDPQAANLLKAALDDKRRRKVCWMKENADNDLESEFDFTGRVIFISNIPMMKFNQALRSRAMMVDLAMSFTDKIDRMRKICPDMAPDATKEERNDALAFVLEFGEKMNDFNFRTLEKVIKLRMGAGENWANMAEYMTLM